jgi:hypothetical protein
MAWLQYKFFIVFVFLFISLGDTGKGASETHSMWMDSDDPDFVPSSADENEEFNPCKKLILLAYQIIYLKIVDSELGQKKALKRKAAVKPVRKSDGSSEDWKTDDSDWEKHENQNSKKRKKKGMFFFAIQNFK